LEIKAKWSKLLTSVVKISMLRNLVKRLKR
jgi:hypothetical protein